jgi:single-strand DNA-binding protein
VVGRLHLNEWTSRDGEKRSRLQVVADTVEFLDSPKKTAAAEPAGEQEAKPASRSAAGSYRKAS